MVDERDKNIFVAGNQSTVVDFCENFIDAGYRISGLIHMQPEFSDKIADYVDMRDYAKQNDIPLYQPQTYSMTSEADKKLFSDLMGVC